MQFQSASGYLVHSSRVTLGRRSSTYAPDLILHIQWQLVVGVTREAVATVGGIPTTRESTYTGVLLLIHQREAEWQLLDKRQSKVNPI